MKLFGKFMHFGAKADTFRYAEYLRQNPTKAEEILWERLRKNQIECVRFRRQHPLLRYVPDFYAHAVKLVVELDGEIHDEEVVKLADAFREENIKLHGIKILRYRNEDVYNFIDDVVEDIRYHVCELKNLKKKR
jgi:very-short-patch-repair endonuclease